MGTPLRVGVRLARIRFVRESVRVAGHDHSDKQQRISNGSVQVRILGQRGVHAHGGLHVLRGDAAQAILKMRSNNQDLNPVSTILLVGIYRFI